jgi:hypothetical protein
VQQYRVKIMQGREVLLEGVLAEPKPKSKIALPDRAGVNLDDAAFAMERAINSQTDCNIRAHIEAIE